MTPRLLDIYKLTVEMADRVSARRAGANAFFVSVQSAVIASLGFLDARQPGPSKWLLVSLAVVGILAASTWYLLLRSYRDLNKAKFAVINELERSLPVRPYGMEWDQLKQDPVRRWRGRYAELGTVERLGPVLFALLNLLLAIYLGTR